MTPPTETSDDCIFCRIAQGELDATVVHEEEDLLAFRDLDPQAPEHILLIPRRHIASVNELSAEHETLMGRLVLAAGKVARALELSDDGYRLVVNTGEDGGQSVSHIHLHLLGGRALRWPPG